MAATSSTAGKPAAEVNFTREFSAPLAVPFLSGMEMGWSQGLERFAASVSRSERIHLPAPRHEWILRVAQSLLDCGRH